MEVGFIIKRISYLFPQFLKKAIVELYYSSQIIKYFPYKKEVLVASMLHKVYRKTDDIDKILKYTSTDNNLVKQLCDLVYNKKKDENWKLIPRWSYILRKMDIDLEKIKLKFNYHIFSPFTIKVKTENELNKLIEEYSHRNKKKDNVLNYFYYYILQLKIKTGIEYVDQEMENKDKKNKNIVLSII